MTCAQHHPEDQGRTCLLPVGSHSHHSDAAGVWPNETPSVQAQVQMLATPRKSRTVKGKAREIRSRAQEGIDAHRAEERRENGIPPEAVAKWAQDDWATYAGRVTDAFLRQRSEPFTTAEHLWPCLDAPEEMRALSLLVRRLLKAGHIEEVGATRLKGTYTTKDGHSFQENKLVPIYRSTICEGVKA